MRERRPIVIFGSGGFAREVAELVRDIDAAERQWELLGFVDDDPRRHGSMYNELPVLGGREWFDGRSRQAHVAIGVGNPPLKRRIATDLVGRGLTLATLVHPTVIASRFVEIGAGVIVTAGTILTANIRLGECVTLNLQCTVGHDVSVERFVTCAPGVNVSGNVLLGEGCDVGTGAAIIQGVAIGAWSIVGAGAVVAKPLPENCTAVGVPARVIKERPSGWHID